MWRRIVLLAAAMALGAPELPAQLDLKKGDKPPRRPRLPPAADTNSALAYYTFGISRIRSRPREAADAFYWALRLDPTVPQHYTARRIALMRLNERRLFYYLMGDEPVQRSEEQQRLDSLEYISRAHDPFMHRSLEIYLFEPFVDNWVAFQNSGPGLEGWLAYAKGDFEKAVQKYGEAMKMSGAYGWIWRNDRANAWFLLEQFDSVLVDLDVYEEELRRNERDRRRFIVLYRSKAMSQYMKGITQFARGDSTAGREALGRALMEDLAFYMAHARLASVAAASGDTATAIAEYDLAVQSFENDPAIRSEYGLVLLQSGRVADAEAQFRKALELEPYYADLQLFLGRALDLQDKRAEAVPYYEAFIARAIRDDERVEWVRQRVSALAAR